MHGADTFETPHPTVLTMEQAYRLPSSKPRSALTPYSPLPTASAQGLKENYRAARKNSMNEEHEPALQIPSSKTLSSITLASSPPSGNRELLKRISSSKAIIHASHNSSPPMNFGTLPTFQPKTFPQVDEIPKKLRLKDKMKSRSTSTKTKLSRMSQNAAHIPTSVAQFQSFITGRGEGSRNTGNLTLASPFISRASSPIPGSESGRENAGNPNELQPSSLQLVEKPTLRERFFDPNRPAKPLQRKRLSQSHNGSPLSLKGNLLAENVLLATKRKGRERYLDYQSPLLSSPRKKSSAIRERRPSAPSRLRRSKGSSSVIKTKKSPEKAIASCPTSPSKPLYAPKDKTIMGPPSFIPSRLEKSYSTHAQTPLSDAHRQPIYESDLDSDLECPGWLRSSMGIGSVDFNRPPSQMSCIGFSHSGEEVDDWIESEDEHDSRYKLFASTRAMFSNTDVDGVLGDVFGEDARGVSTPPNKPRRVLSLLAMAAHEQQAQSGWTRDLPTGGGSDGEVDMELSSIVDKGHPALPDSILRANSSRTATSDDESTSKYTSQLISLDEAADISWSTDSIISPPTIYLERGLRKGGVGPSEKRSNASEQAMALTMYAERDTETRTAADDFRGKAKHKDLPMLDLRALQGNSGKTVSSTAQPRTIFRTQSLPVAITSPQPIEPVLAVATKRTRSGTIVPADHYDPASIPAPPHSKYLADDAEASSSGFEHGVGRTRSGTVVRCNSGKLAPISTQADDSMCAAPAVPLSMTRRTRSGTIQAFAQPFSGEGRRLRSGSVSATSPALVVSNRASCEEAVPLSGTEANTEVDMAGIEEEDIEFAPPEPDELSPTQHQGISLILSDYGARVCADKDRTELRSPFVDDAYIPRDISSPDPIDFLSFCASRVDECVKIEISAGIEGTWNTKFDGDECTPDHVPTLLWSVADPPSPQVALRRARESRPGYGNLSKTPVRRRNHTGKRPMTRKARFEGFHDEIDDALLAQKTTDVNLTDEGADLSDDELDLFASQWS